MMVDVRFLSPYRIHLLMVAIIHVYSNTVCVLCVFLCRDNENVHVHEMEGFKLPPFLLAKVQHYIRSLQSKC